MKFNKTNQVLMGAQFWAYGPAGKANAIAHELAKKGIKADFVGSETSYQLCSASGFFGQLHNFNSGIRLDGFPDYRTVVSVMDPYLALWARKRKIRLLYVDSMSWFWRWKDLDQQVVKDAVSRIEATSFADGCKKLDEFEPDQRQLFAHLIADKIFGQGEPQVTEETRAKASNAGSMIDLNFISPTKRDTLMISLSGGISPATDLAGALKYARFVFDLLGERLKRWPGAVRFIVTGHPSVIANLDNCPKYIEPIALSQSDFLKELNRAVAVLVPCGFTTVYEALAYGAPLAFLPENHNGHVYEYLVITKGLDATSAKEDVFPNALFGLEDADLGKIKPIDESMDFIRNCTERFYASADYKKRFEDRVDSWPAKFEKPQLVYDKQKKQILTTIPDFKGALRVADEVSKILLEDHD